MHIQGFVNSILYQYLSFKNEKLLLEIVSEIFPILPWWNSYFINWGNCLYSIAFHVHTNQQLFVDFQFVFQEFVILWSIISSARCIPLLSINVALRAFWYREDLGSK